MLASSKLKEKCNQWVERLEIKNTGGSFSRIRLGKKGASISRL